MAEIDVAQEWRRLQSLYAGMSEEELEAVADEGYELTDVAKQALNAEISRRNLKIVIQLAPAPETTAAREPGGGNFDPAGLDLSAISLPVINADEAGQVKTMLHDAGIPCFFGPDLVDDLDELEYSKDGVGVHVLKADLARAQFVLRDLLAKTGEDEEALPDYSVHCPKCHSTEILFQGLDALQDEEPEDTEATEQNLTEHTRSAPKYNWSCDACGYQWKDDGVESES